tara:strand:- start:603 stop:1664 length:1062 start_codon:yes stop_codon:yes gene_type:complete
MIIKNIFSFAASIISFVIFIFLNSANSNAEENNIKRYSKDEGILSIMYHRFNENKYPSTNIRMNIFKEHMQIIEDLGYKFYNPKLFIEEFSKKKENKKILITIDDAYKSFYTEAWPFLRENNIPFILFVSTEPIGKRGYMNWDEINDIEKSEFGMIGHHSHSHEYLIDESNSVFINDIETANKIFKSKLGYVPKIFSYPFGEYSKFMKDYIAKNFKVAFGQHSGVIDLNKNKYELPRFPINEKYGELKRFKSLINYFPLEYKKIIPEEKLLTEKTNPPSLKIHFFKDQDNIKLINCYSNDGGDWGKPNMIFENNILSIKFNQPFEPRRGRINCSLNDNGKWRWFGTQFTIKKN